MKYAADPSNWIFGSETSICQLNNGKYVNTSVQKCDVIFAGAFNKANVSIVSALLPLSLDKHDLEGNDYCRSLVSSTRSCGVQICGSCTRRRPGSLMDLNSSKLNNPPNLHLKCTYDFGYYFAFNVLTRINSRN